MSEDELNVENEEKITTKLKNTKNGDEIEMDITKENAQKLKNLIDEQNRQSKEIVDENNRLRQEKANNPASFGALLNEAQITGQTTIPLDSNDGLPTDMQIFSDELDMVNQLEKQNTAESKRALNDLLVKSSKGSWQMDYEGNDTKALFKTPKTDAEKKDFAQKRRMWSVTR
jgi:hypothetical protein